jgi:hypothetical protein
MKYGQIAGNTHINAMIYHCFEYICEEDEQKFVKKFREQPDDSDQIMHTFRELVLGAYLSSSGFRVRYDYVVGTKTPDWCILDGRLSVTGIVELTSIHVDKSTEDEIEEQLQAMGMAAVWRDQHKDNVARLYHRIWEKAQVYRELAEELKVSYVVGVFCEFQAAIDLEELGDCLFDEEYGLFKMYPELSGVLYFEGSSSGFLFSYLHNPNSRRSLLPCRFPGAG